MESEFKEIWIKRKDETNRAYQAFCHYRDYGPGRSHTKVIREKELQQDCPSQWSRWCTKFNWVKRSEAYDQHLEGLARIEKEKDFQTREQQHLNITKKIMDIIEKKLESFDPEELSQNNLMDWLKEGIAIERTGFGKDGQEAQLPQLEISFTEEFKGL